MTEPNEKVAADRRALTMRVRLSPYTGSKTNLSRRVTVGASPADVYEVLVDSERHGALVGAATDIGTTMGDPVSLLDGDATGIVMEVLPDRHVVLALQHKLDGWPDRHSSTATFMLRAEAAGGTTVVVFEQDVPTDLADAVAERWQTAYVDKLAAAFPL